MSAFVALWISAIAVPARGAGREQQADDYYAQATAAYGLGRYDEAARLYESAFEANPKGPLLYNAAQAYRRAGNKERALELYRNYLRLFGRGSQAGAAKRQIAELERELAAAGGASTKSTAPAQTAPAQGTAKVVRAPAPAVTPAALSPAPAPVVPAAPRQGKLSAGGEECTSTTAQLDFESPVRDLVVDRQFRAFSNASLDRTRAWCGDSSLRLDASFNLEGVRTSSGSLPAQLGQLSIKLPAITNLTGRTVSVYVYVEGPPQARFGAQVFAVQGGVWVPGKASENLAAGRWHKISHTFAESTRLWSGGYSKVDAAEGVAFQVHAFGSKEQRVWTGKVFIDDFAWF